MNVFIFFRNFNHAVKFSFDKVQDVDVLSNVEEGRESGVVELIGETTAFRCFSVKTGIAALKQVSKAGRTPMTPIRTFEISVTLGELGLG